MHFDWFFGRWISSRADRQKFLSHYHRNKKDGNQLSLKHMHANEYNRFNGASALGRYIPSPTGVTNVVTDKNWSDQTEQQTHEETWTQGPRQLA